MKRVLPYITFLFLFLLIPDVVIGAWYCDYADMAKVKNIASNITTSYDYKINNNKADFTITITNIYKDIYIYDTFHDKYYYPKKGQDMTEVTLSNFPSGGSYLFQVYTTIDKCEEEIVYSFYVTTPTYNKYYNDALCRDYQGYELCNRWANLNNMSYEEFKRSMTEYINSNKKTDDIVEDEEEIQDLIEFYLEYYMYILPTIIVTLLGIIYLIKKSDSFNL